MKKKKTKRKNNKKKNKKKKRNNKKLFHFGFCQTLVRHILLWHTFYFGNAIVTGV